MAVGGWEGGGGVEVSRDEDSKVLFSFSPKGYMGGGGGGGARWGGGGG